MKLSIHFARFAMSAALLALAAARTFAQSTADITPPHLKDGHPDLQGLWKLAASGPPPKAGTGIFAGMHYLPGALAERDAMAKRPHEDFVGQCVTASVPGAALYPPYPSLIMQDGKFVVIMYEFAHDVRIIPVDGSPHPKGPIGLNGDSRGHWEGDTLVVDVANFSKGKRWLNMGADYLDENSHVVERYTLAGPDTLAYEVTVEDPSILSGPWNARASFNRQPKTDQILEGACREGERDLDHYVSEDGKSK